MSSSLSGTSVRASVALGICLWIGAGCSPAGPLDRAGLRLAVPSGWTAVAPDRWLAPGVPVAAWSGPGGASLVVYRTLPAPGMEVSHLADALANRLDNLPGVRVVSRGPVTISGRSAARLDAVGPGDGSAFVPSGAGVPVAPEGVAIQPTRRIVVAVPRSSDTLHLVFHAPESAAATLDAAVKETLASIALAADSGPASSSGY